jgi:mannose/fructose/N-acetylgalactosamine-specific phosphotransferase system component IIC
VEYIYIGLIGSLLILDTTVLFQFSVSQPLIICTILGFYFGDVPLGMQIGIYLQLLWLSSMPVGATVVPEGNMAALVSAVMIFRYHHDMQLFHTVMIMAIIYGLVLSYLGGELVVIYRKNNIRILHNLIRNLKDEDINSLPLSVMSSVILHTVLMFLVILSALSIGDFVFQYVSDFPAVIEKYARFAVISILGVGTGLLLQVYKDWISRVLILVGTGCGFLIPFIS